MVLLFPYKLEFKHCTDKAYVRSTLNRFKDRGPRPIAVDDVLGVFSSNVIPHVYSIRPPTDARGLVSPIKLAPVLTNSIL